MKFMTANLTRAKNKDLLALINAGDNILGECYNWMVLDTVVAAACELKRRGRNPETGKRLTVKR